MRNPFSSRSGDCVRPIEINVNVRGLEHSGIAELKTLINALSAQLTQLKDTVMTTSAEFTAAFERLNVATSQIATVLAGISANIGNMSADEETAAKAQLDAAVASLEAMATNAANPVPVEPPVTP